MAYSTCFITLCLALLNRVAHADLLWNDVCTQPDVKSTAWCDTTRTSLERATAFVAALQPEEKVPIMTNEAQGVKRLYIPPYQWGSEGLHGPLEPCVCGPSKANGGANKCACPTSFPAPSAMGSAFNTTLYWMVGHHDGLEARAINNCRNHETQNNYGDGIDYWSPTINMQRDPRWGRNQEVPGEDPMLTGQYAANFVNGLQGEANPLYPNGVDPKHTLIVGCCKHFVANSLESWEGHTRHNFDAQIPLRDMADYYLPAFKGCVMEGKVKGIMCSYNAVNGVPMCANSLYLNETLRNSWGFSGYVTSDCDAVGDVYESHHYATPENGTALSLKAGTDMDCGDWGAHAYLNELPGALKDGLVSEADLDRALVRLTKIQMELGLFDPKEDQIFFNLGIDTLLNRPVTDQIALEGAEQSIVLLKNEKILPLPRGKNIAVIGPHSAGNEVFMSNYHGSACLDSNGNITSSKNFSCIQSPYEAIAAANIGGKTVQVDGCTVTGTAPINQSAIDAAKAADIVVLVMGIDGTVEGEGHDRTTIDLPGQQQSLINQTLALKKPTVLLLVNGGAVALGSIKDASPAIVECFYGGTFAAQAMANVLFGDYNPSGRLAITVYPADFVNEVPLTQMSVTEPPGRTHMYYNGTTEFVFGEGLSYDTWELDWTETPKEILMSTNTNNKTKLDVKIRNRGSHGGKITVLAMWKPQDDESVLRQKLFAFDGQVVRAGEEGSIHFELKPEHFAVANTRGDRVVSPGKYDIVITGFSDTVPLYTSLTLTGEEHIIESYAL